MSQPQNNSFCGIKKQHWTKILGVIFILCFIVYMKFTLYEPLGRNDFQIISIDAKSSAEFSTDNYENRHESDASKLEHTESSTTSSDDVENKIPNDMKSDKINTLPTNLEDKKNSTDQSVVKTENTENSDSDTNKLKYILQWTSGKLSPFYHMGSGQKNFFKLNCPYTNCFITDNKKLLPHLSDYDAIVFNGNNVIKMNKNELPQERSPKQKYIFGGTEPAALNLACKPVLDNFFNWTWTYRLDSDIHWRYVTVFDLNGTAVGPKVNMNWPEEMEPIDSETKMILDGKSKAAAWFVSNCKTPNHREDVVETVSKELEAFGLSVDIYGNCGKLSCPRSNSKKCFKMVEKDYYFYFSFENSFSVDYVTEKLLTAVDNYAVPVVYGGADYSRFLPPGSYLNARVLSPKALAATIRDLINDKERYYDFFRWRNHFKYKRTEDSNDICNICSALNDRQKVITVSTRPSFRKWWNDEWNATCKV